jgi:cytochrome c-type biogenesis protein CcmF
VASREAAFLFNNLALVGVAFSVLWGTLFPILSEWARGTKITVGPPFFNRVNIPLGLFLLFLTGVGPLIAWRKASARNLQRQFIFPVAAGLVAFAVVFAAGLRSGYALISLSLAGFVLGTVAQEFGRGVRARRNMHNENYALALVHLISRNRRRYGGYIVHVGIVLYFVAFTGYAFKTTREVEMVPGDSQVLRSPFGHDVTFTYLGVSQFNQLNRRVSAVTLRVSRDGQPIGEVVPEKRQHVNSLGEETFQPSTEVGLMSSLREDIYVMYAGSPDGTEKARLTLIITPLVMWFWIGGAVLVLGGVLAMWPGGPEIRAKVRSRQGETQAGYAASLSGTGAAT